MTALSLSPFVDSVRISTRSGVVSLLPAPPCCAQPCWSAPNCPRAALLPARRPVGSRTALPSPARSSSPLVLARRPTCWSRATLLCTLWLLSVYSPSAACTNLTPLPAPVPVRLADPSGGPVLARSSAVLPCLAVPSGSLSGLHLPSFSTNLVSTAALQDAMVTTTTPRGQHVSICTCTQMGHHLATFTRQLGSSLYTLATEPPQVAASIQVSVSGPVAALCSCRLQSHQTLLWHHRLGHPSLPRLRGMHFCLFVSGLPRSLPPLSPSPPLPCLPCVEGRQRAAPHSSFPPTNAPLKGEVPDVLIPWIRTVCLQLREQFRGDLPVLRLHSDRGGEFSSDLLQDFFCGEGILWSFMLPASQQQNRATERRIGLVMEVARTSMIHAPAPHLQWPFAVQYAAHQLNLWPLVSLPETSPTLHWTGKVGDASVFRVAVDSGAARGAASGGAEPASVEPGSGCAEPDGAEAGGAESDGAESRGAKPRGTACAGSHTPSEWSCRSWRLRRWRAGGAGATSLGGAGVTAGAGGTGGAGAAGLGGARTRGTGVARAGGVGGVGAGDPGAGGTSAGGAGAGGARAGGTGALDPRAGGAGPRGAGAGGTGAGGTVQRRPFFVPPPPSPLPPLDSVLRQNFSVPAPTPYAEQIDSLTKRRELESRHALPVRVVCTGRLVPCPRPLSVPGTHIMALRPSSVPLRPPCHGPALLPPKSRPCPAAAPVAALSCCRPSRSPALAARCGPALLPPQSRPLLCSRPVTALPYCRPSRGSSLQPPCRGPALLLPRSGGAGACTYVLRIGGRRGETCALPHTAHRCFGRLTNAWRAQFPDIVELPCWGDLLKQNVAIFDLDFDAILAAMYVVTGSAEGDCYLSVPPDPGIEAAALGASASAAPGTGESALSRTAPTEDLHTFTLDSGASRSFFRDSTTLMPLSRPVAVSLADPSGGPVLAHSSTVLPCPAAPSGLLSGLHLPSFSTNLVSGADLQDAWVDQFTPGGQRVTHCTCSRTGRHLTTFTRRPGSSLYTLTTESPPVAASAQVVAFGQVFFAASRSSPVSAPCSCRPLSHETLLWHHRLGHPSLPRLRGMASRTLVSGLPQTLPLLPPGPAPTCVPCVEGRQHAAPHSSEFPPTEAPLQTLHMDVWGPARVRGQGHERYFLLVVDDYSRYTIVFPLRSKGEVTEYAAHQINLQPRVSLPETTPTLRWTGKVGDASVFRGPVPSSVSQVDLVEPVEPGGAEPDRVEPGGAEPGGAESRSAEHGGAEPERAESGGPPGVESRREPLSPQQLSGASGAGAAGGAAGAGAAGGAARAGAAGGTAAAGAAGPGGTGAGGTGAVGAAGGAGAAGHGGARTGGTGAAGAGGASGVGAASAGAVATGGAAGAGAVGVTGAGGAAGVVARDPRAEGTSTVSALSRNAARPRPYYVPLLQQVLGPPPPLLIPPPVQPQLQLQPASPLPGPSPYSGSTRGLTEHREPESRPASPESRSESLVHAVHTGRSFPRQRPPPVPGTHSMTLRPSTAPQCVPLPSPPASSLPDGPDLESNSLRAASPTVTRFLATTPVA
ncbi:unnamed protein product [Closterium sp. NIES-54]